MATHVVNFTFFAFANDQIDRFAMIKNMEPVTNILHHFHTLEGFHLQEHAKSLKESAFPGIDMDHSCLNISKSLLAVHTYDDMPEQTDQRQPYLKSKGSLYVMAFLL